MMSPMSDLAGEAFKLNAARSHSNVTPEELSTGEPMTNLTEFLRARIADEESLALDAATEGTPHRTGWQLWTMKIDTTPGGELLGPRGSVEASPARVETECAAKRAIVEDFEDYANEYRKAHSDFAAGRRHAALLAVTRIAAIYADHSDYQDEWRP